MLGTLLAMGLFWTSQGWAQSQVPYSTGFESPTFSLGALPQDGWTAVTGSPVIQNSVVFQGSQALQVPAGSATEKLFTSTAGSVIWLDGRTRVTPDTGAPDPTLLRTGSTFVFFDSVQGILCLNGNGNGGGSWSATGVNPAAGTWVRISLQINFTAKTYNAYVDGVLRLSNLGFRNNTIDKLNGFSVDHQQSAGGSYLDAFSASTAAPDFLATPTPTNTPVPSTPTPTRTNTPVASTPTPTPTSPANMAHVRLAPVSVIRHHPPSGVAVADATASFDIMIDNAEDLGKFDVRLSYGTTAVQLTGAGNMSVGPFLSSTGNSVSMTKQNYNNTSGTAAVAAQETGVQPGPNGTGVLARVVWHTKAVTGMTVAPLQILGATITRTAGTIQPSDVTGGATFTVCFFADLDCNNTINIVDIQVVAGRWNTAVGNPSYDPAYDIDKDGDIDIADVQRVAGQWNKSAPF